MHSDDNQSRDRFLLWALIILPVISQGSYIFDAYFHYHNVRHSTMSTYEGFFSTVVIFFAYLQYAAPIRSRRYLILYHVSIWMLGEIGNLGYLLSFIYEKKFISLGVYIGWTLVDTVYVTILIYCRAIRRYENHIPIENRHIFHFLSRLEVILAIFIPIFINDEFSTIQRDTIAFFLLFDFFAEKYDEFSGIAMKSCLYLFVIIVTNTVAFEWLYFRTKTHAFEYVAEISELIAASLFYSLVILQHFAYNFKPRNVRMIAREIFTQNENIQIESKI